MKSNFVMPFIEKGHEGYSGLLRMLFFEQNLFILNANRGLPGSHSKWTNFVHKTTLQGVLNLSIVDLRLDVSSMGRKKEPTMF